jgi:translation initiation factor 2 gamma subunit (eIF-2gamma)
MIFFAQVPVNVHSDTSLGQWGMLIVMVLGAIGALWIKIQDSKKDSVAQEVQKEQRDSLKELLKGQTAQNGKLAEVVKVNDIYHNALISALNTTCKAQPVLVQQVNQPTKDKEIKQ